MIRRAIRELKVPICGTPADSSTPNADATSQSPKADPAVARTRAVVQAWTQTRVDPSRAHFVDLGEPGLCGVNRCSCRRHRCGRIERHGQAEYRNRCTQRDAGRHASPIWHALLLSNYFCAAFLSTALSFCSGSLDSDVFRIRGLYGSISLPPPCLRSQS